MPKEVQFGGDLKINDFISIRVLTLEEVLDMGYSEYEEMIRVITMCPFDDFIELSEREIDYRTVDDWDYFWGFYITNKSLVVKYLNILTTYDWSNCYALQNKTIKDLEKDGFVFDVVLYREMLSKIDKIYRYKKFKEKEKNFGDFNAVKYYAKQKRKKIERFLKKSKDGKTSTEKIVSFLCWNSPSINFINVTQLNMYQIYDGVDRLETTQNYKDIMTGIYTGNIKKDNIDIDSIHWMN
jgi:hypothetical protein